ncbi:MAG: ABC transporter ATP-binding protein [Egibacteraceae bacterium]
MRGLVKVYGERRVIDEVSFEVPPGSVLALLGVNGAGKTTTVECIEGFRRPDGGEVRVLGLDPRRDRDAVVARMGVMLQEGGAYQSATPREMLALYARFYPQPRPVGELLELVGLEQVAGARYRSLSGGERQRLNLALALVGRPEVVILDEPTAGMDPQARRTTWEHVRGLRDEGAAVLLTTHFMEEAERLADTVAVIDQGRLLALDAPAALVASSAPNRLLVTTPAAVDPTALAAAVGAPVTVEGTGRLTVEAGPDAIPVVSAWFAEQGLPLTGVSAGGGGLEDAFLRLTAKGPGSPRIRRPTAGGRGDVPHRW